MRVCVGRGGRGGSRPVAAHPFGSCPGSPPGNLPRLVGSRGGMRAGRSPREAEGGGERGSLVLQGFLSPSFLPVLQETFFLPV